MLLIKRQLLVLVKVDSSKKLGNRTSAVVPGFNFIGEMEGGQLLQYSNAAIKQMANDSFLYENKLTKKLDMILGFNQDKQWYFGDGEIAANELDFECRNF